MHIQIKTDLHRAYNNNRTLFTRADLRQICRQLHVSQHGTKADVIRRLDAHITFNDWISNPITLTIEG